MKILVTGSEGQVGNEISRLQQHNPSWKFFFTDIKDFSICDYNTVDAFVKSNAISSIINCAAYAAVDKAETDKDLAYEVNVTGPTVLAKIAAERGLKFIHVSTDFIFNGKNYLPLKEDDPADPTNVYGETKYQGELAVLKECPSAIIIRTSWLYSKFGNNFVKTMRRFGSERQELRVIADQIGSPTWAADLAKCILHILADAESGISKCGVFHYSNEGAASWYDFAHSIIELSGLDCRVIPIPTSEYPTPAKRPHYSLMDKSLIKKTFTVEVPHWRDSLKNCLAELDKI